MKGRKIIRKWLLCLLCAAMLLLAGCTREEQQIRIIDGRTETRLSAKQGITVEQVLKEAEITIEKGDEVSPSKDTVLSGEKTEILIHRRAEVTVVQNKKEQKIVLTGGKVKDAIEGAKIQIGKNDMINHDPEAYLTDGMKIEVIRRYAVVINADGKWTECLTRADTVEGLLKEQKIRLDAKDQISPGTDEKLKDGTEVVIQRVSVKQVTEYESIPYDTKTEYSDSMYEDETVRKQQGKNGKKEVTYEITYVDGKEEYRNVINEKVIETPVSGIVLKGTMGRRRIVSKEAVMDCDGSGHGYYIITWSDGAVEYEDF